MYQKMYTTLFNAITDALRLMEKGTSAEAAALLPVFLRQPLQNKE